jgi:hypothetical protein
MTASQIPPISKYKAVIIKIITVNVLSPDFEED